MAYDPELDNVVQSLGAEEGEDGLLVLVASYGTGPLKVRIKRRKGGKVYDASPIAPEEVDDLIELLQQVE